MSLNKRQKSFAPVDRTKAYSLAEAVKLVKQNAKCKKLNETIDVAVNLGVDPKHADQQVRGMVSPRHGTGKSLRVAVFARGDKAAEAKAAGADIIGAEDLLEIVIGGKTDFDRCIATPDMMPVIARAAKVLGPKGLMPTPKLGTVTTDVTKAVKDAKGGAIEFRVEKAGIVHAGIGKASMTEQQLVDNINDVLAALNKAKPTGAKGTYVKRVTLSSTMGPGVKVDITTLAA